MTQVNTPKIHHKKSVSKPVPKSDPLAELFSDEEERKKYTDKKTLNEQPTKEK